MSSILSALQGKKTFLCSALAVVATGLGMYSGHISVAEGIPAILVATGISTSRQGSKNDAATAAATVVKELAPIVAAAAPGTANAADLAEQIAGQIAGHMLAGVPARTIEAPAA